MEDYKYRVSMIVPVYNASEYLRGCLDSLLAQNIRKGDMEVILVDDGSKDNSLQICNEYAKKSDMFKVFTKTNSGSSAARNYGIKKAVGKYIMFLDSDDTLSPETVKEVADCFDAHYDEVDLVTYKDQPYRFGKKLQLHYRYRYLKNTAVYSLDMFPFITQTRLNVCVKNLFGDNVLFNEDRDFSEDQEYCTEILMRKNMIGFCAKGEYQYNRNNLESFVEKYCYAYYIFESSMEYFEKLYGRYEGEVPAYIQALFINDISWKLRDNQLYPYHYDDKKLAEAKNRIIKLLERTDVDNIVNHPQVDNFSMNYWISMKPNVHPAVIANEKGVNIIADGKQIYHKDSVELIAKRVRVRDGIVRFQGFIKTPIYNYIPEDAKIYVIENGDENNKRLLDTRISVHSRYLSNEQTCRFFWINYSCDSEKVESFEFVVEVDGFVYKPIWWMALDTGFNTYINSFVRNNVLLSLKDNTVHLKKLNDDEVREFELKNNDEIMLESYDAYDLRKEAINSRAGRRIWLYYDLHTVEKDNGYYQFINDIKHDDGVERYYVFDKDPKEMAHLFNEEQMKKTVRFGSMEHKLLYICAEKVLTSFLGFSPISPFRDPREQKKYEDLLNFEIIYLQHGVMHAELLFKNHNDLCSTDKIIISTQFEKDNLTSKYGYDEEDLIFTGMSRFDHIDKTKEAKKKILFAPSWRSYLAFEKTLSRWDISEERVKATDYYIKFNDFLNDKKLHDTLREHGMQLEFKMHPIIKDSKGVFDVENDVVRMAPNSVSIEDYDVFITDFSSYIFDFIYLKRPVIYFVPDMDQFKSGMNHYRNLDLPFEKAFGNLVLTPEDATKELARILENSCKVDDIYKNRMDKFYPELKDCAESLYEYLIKNV